VRLFNGVLIKFLFLFAVDRDELPPLLSLIFLLEYRRMSACHSLSLTPDVLSVTLARASPYPSVDA